MELYTRIICLFNTRKLSFLQDCQAAFSGVLHSFSRAFFGGFINALPRLFLDAALLWQPCKGYMVRRIPRAGSGMEPNYPQDLPTWSWCGWECAIDPRSMAFARDFEYPLFRRHHWTLTHLVQWSVMSNHREQGDNIREPAILQRYRNYMPATTDPLPSGWKINTSSVEAYGNVTQRRWFSHDTVQPEYHTFAYPVPLPDSENNEAQSFNTSWPFLTGSTTIANLRVRSTLTPDRLTKDEKSYCQSHTMVRLSVKELPEFTAGPDDCFSVAVLEDEHGTWAGVLRVAETYEAGKEKESLRLGEKAELIALSRGQVPCRVLLDERDTNDLSEEQIDNRGWVKFNSYEVNRGQEGDQGTYTQSRIRFRREGLDKDDQDYKGGKLVYEFYNVTWIVREQGVLYHRGVGRVCRSIWEKSCSDREKVVIG